MLPAWAPDLAVILRRTLQNLWDQVLSRNNLLLALVRLAWQRGLRNDSSASS
jgi:hypothetical protein